MRFVLLADAGHYVPNIAWEIAANATAINLQVMLIGSKTKEATLALRPGPPPCPSATRAQTRSPSVSRFRARAPDPTSACRP